MFWIKLHFHSKFPSFINSQCKVCSYFGSGFAIDVDKNTLVIDMNFFFLSRIWRQFLLNFYVQFNSRNLIVSDPLPHLMVKYMEGFFLKKGLWPMRTSFNAASRKAFHNKQTYHFSAIDTMSAHSYRSIWNRMKQILQNIDDIGQES